MTTFKFSAGVGRTGTFIALDYLIQQAETEGKLDMYNYVYNLKHQRVFMIQSEVRLFRLHHTHWQKLIMHLLN